MVENVDVLQVDSIDKNFLAVADSIKDKIYKDKPDQGIDHLHTFIVKYIRNLCDKYLIEYDRDIPLHSLFGRYVKFLESGKNIESEMTLRILKNSISILESFNKARNTQSLAHDNPILNYNESILIFNNVLSMINFIKAIEEKTLKKEQNSQEDSEIKKEQNSQEDSEIKFVDIPF